MPQQAREDGKKGRREKKCGKGPGLGKPVSFLLLWEDQKRRRGVDQADAIKIKIPGLRAK
jgi:hypothetical protein